MSYLRVMVDLAGCPNRCRYCRLGNLSRHRRRIQALKGQNGQRVGGLSFFNWWRGPHYRDDYRELWRIEQELSSPDRAMRFELLSIWRLARDENYAKWAALLSPKACQITFSVMEENTDWLIRRKGAFNEWLLATERLIVAFIATARVSIFAAVAVL